MTADGAFDADRYVEQVLRPLRRATRLPDDLLPRYALDDLDQLDDAAVADRIRRVHALWTNKARLNTYIGNVCQQLLNAHDALVAEHGDGALRTVRWWTTHLRQQAADRQPEVDALAAALRAAFGEIGLVGPAPLAAEAAAYPALTPEDVAEAVRRAGLREVPAADLPRLPRTSGLRDTTFGTLRALLVDAQVTSLPALLGGNSPTAAGVRAARERVDRGADSPMARARREALGILDAAARDGVDLAALALFHAVEPVRAARARGTQPAGLLRMLRAAGLDRPEAAAVVTALLDEDRAPTPGEPDALARVRALLATGRLVAAGRAAEALDGPVAAQARALVREHADRVADLRATAAAALAGGRDEAAATGLRAAVELAADLPDLAAELAALPPPPVPELTVRPDGTGVRLTWRRATGHADGVAYRVVRRVDRPPADPDDGDLLGTTTDTALDDPDPPVGRPVHYAVFAGRDGTWSRPRAAAPLRLVPPVAAVRVLPEPGAIGIAWRAHPEVVAVRAARDTGAESIEVDATATSLYDDDVEEGVEYRYSLRAVYRVPEHPEPLLAEAVPVRAATRPDPKPVTDVTVATVGDPDTPWLQVRWRQPEGVRVVVRRAAQPPPWDIGDPIATEALAGYGEELTGPVVHADGRATLTAPAVSGTAYYVPFTVAGPAAVRGPERVFGFTRPVRGVAAERFGARLRVRWVWPDDGASAAEVSWPGGTRRLTRRQYREDGGCWIDAAGDVVAVAVTALVMTPTGWSRSRARAVSLAAEPPRVGYAVERHGSRLLGGVRLRVRVRAATPVRLRLRVVAVEGRDMPRDPAAGRLLHDGDLDLTPEAEAVVEAELPRLRRPYWVRCFADGGVLLVDPPTSQLKVP